MKRSIVLLRRQRSLSILAILGILAVVRLWILPLGNSFWLDEALVVAIARNRLADIAAVAYQANQPILFSHVGTECRMWERGFR